MSHSPWFWYTIVAVGVVLGVLRLRARWAAAGEASDAHFEEQARIKRMHVELLRHPAWHHLWQSLAAQGIRVSEQPAAGGFRLHQLRLLTPSGIADSLQDPHAAFVACYLEGPRKLVASMALTTGAVHVRDPSFLEWPVA